MARQRRRIFRPSILLAESVLLQGLLVAAAAHAAGPAMSVPDATGPRATTGDAMAQAPADLYLDVQLNGMPRGLAPFVWRDGELWASAATLQQLGFVLPVTSADPQRLRTLPGLTLDYNAARQSVSIMAPLAALDLPTTVVGAPGIAAQAASASPGLLLNYDLYGTQARAGRATLGAFTELRAFSGNTVFSSTALMQGQRADGSDWRGQSARLDTTWSRAFPDALLTLRLGDTLTGALPWSRATRIGGIQLARDFGLQPYRSTAPLPSFIGSATLPSEVELYVNGMRQYSGQVPAGPFQLNTLPSINSAGTAQVVLTDALGRATTVNFPIHDSGRLLAEGLTDWSVDLGVVRQNYGRRSFDYGKELAASGTWRHGLSNSFTVEAHGEATRGLSLAGVGGVWQLGAAGLISSAVSHSAHGDGRGTQLNAGYSWQREGLNLGLSGTRTQGDYRDVAARYGSAPARGTGRATVGYSNATLGSLNLSYLYLRTGEEAATRWVSFNWFKALGRSTSLAFGLNQNLDRRSERNLYVSVNWTLDNGVSMGVGAQRDRDRSHWTASAQNAASSEGGWGWRTTARAGGDAEGGQAEVNYLGRYGRVQAGLSDFGGGSRYGYAGATGGLVLMGGSAFASRRIDDAFAVVSTDGVSDVPVKLENRLVGRTDARGMLLVVPVNAYQNNKLAIDPMQLPADVRIARTDALVTPSDRAGSLVRFGITPIRAASVQLVDAAGRPLALGSRVRVNGQAGEPAIVGHDGLVYLDTLEDQNELRVETPGGVCTARFAWHRDAAGVMQAGPLACEQGVLR